MGESGEGDLESHWLAGEQMNGAFCCVLVGTFTGSRRPSSSPHFRLCLTQSVLFTHWVCTSQTHTKPWRISFLSFLPGNEIVINIIVFVVVNASSCQQYSWWISVTFDYLFTYQSLLAFILTADTAFFD